MLMGIDKVSVLLGLMDKDDVWIFLLCIGALYQLFSLIIENANAIADEINWVL